MYLHILAFPNPDALSGWTKATNLDGKFVNELISYSPDEWELRPLGNNYTVTDGNAFIRGDAPDFKPTGSSIPKGTYVIVTERNGKYAKVSEAVIANDQVSAGKEIGWTASSNLTDGCSKFFLTSAWTDTKGPNACWEHGKFLGAKVLVNIVGVGTVIKQITLDSVENYFKLKEAAAAKNLNLEVTSGFRTFAKQAQLFDLSHHGGNTAAPAGASNHQHGQAFDLNTQDMGSSLYKWMTKNAPKFGFIRTVNGEPWHWEFRPDQAMQLASKGNFKISSVFT